MRCIFPDFERADLLRLYFLGRRIFGAGIASSYGECEYALSARPQIVPFDIEKIRQQEFRIDVFQEKLFLLSSEKQLYDSLDAFVSVYKV